MDLIGKTRLPETQNVQTAGTSRILEFGGIDNQAPTMGDQTVRAIEGMNVPLPSQFQYEDGLLNKKFKNSRGDILGFMNSPSTSNAKMFFKTKLCQNFLLGVCSYINCTFAHGIEELRQPPPNWQEILADNNRKCDIMMLNDRKVKTKSHSSNLYGGLQEAYQVKYLKDYWDEESLNGNSYSLLPDEQLEDRECVVIDLTPTIVNDGAAGNKRRKLKPNLSNRKTKLCYMWGSSGTCRFGSTCKFAHGYEELHEYGGGLVEKGQYPASAPSDLKQLSLLPSKSTDTKVTPTVSAAPTDVLHRGQRVPLRRPSVVTPRPGQRPLRKWKGPDKISKIYGDWIDDLE